MWRNRDDPARLPRQRATALDSPDMLAEIAEWESAEGNWSDIWRRPRPPAPMNARSRCRPTIHGDGDRTAALTAGGSSRSTSPTCSQALRSSDIPLAHSSHTYSESLFIEDVIVDARISLPYLRRVVSCVVSKGLNESKLAVEGT